MTATATPRAATAILVIEDEPSVSAFVRAALERRGYKVVQASSGAAGLQKLEAGSFAGARCFDRHGAVALFPNEVERGRHQPFIRVGRSAHALRIVD